MRIFLFAFSLIFLANSWAQIQGTEEVNGKKYYVYLVQKGNTLYQLEKTYGVSSSVIEKDNPAIKSGLQVGQKILLDIPTVTYTHTVQKGETLYAIAKNSGVSVDHLIKNNPDAQNGVKVGQKISIPDVPKHIADQLAENGIVQPIQVETGLPSPKDTIRLQNQVAIPPAPKYSLQDTIINHTVLAEETLYSLSKRYMVPVAELQKINNLKSTTIKPGVTLKIPIAKENRSKVDIRPVPIKVDERKVDSTILYPVKSKYKIIVLLPFKLDDAASNPYAGVSTDFYMGAKLALDSLESIGLQASVDFIDCGTDSTSLMRVLNNPATVKADLIFGSLMATHNQITAKFCKEKGIRYVSPVLSDASIIKNNPYAYQAVASDVTLMQGLAKYITSAHKGEQVILVNSGNEKDQIMYSAFREAFMASSTTKLIEAKIDNFTTFIKRGANNLVVFPSEVKKSITKFDIDLTKVLTSSTKAQVYGTKDWVDLEDLNVAKAKYDFGFVCPTNFSYDDEKIKSLHRQFRIEYKSDMSKISVHGFDVVFYFINSLLMQQNPNSLFMNDFQMTKINGTSGFENKKSYIFQFENGIPTLK